MSKADLGDEAERAARGASDARLRDVRDYYERNTGLFLRFGKGSSTGAIHRGVWAPGVESLDQALHYVDELVAQTIETHIPINRGSGARLRILDLGCGAGSSLRYLRERLPAQTYGLTLSFRQAQVARARAERGVVVGDFLHTPFRGEFAAALAIESFAHATSAARFFAEAADLLRPGGILFLCDDFLASEDTPARALRWLERFRRGWHLTSLLPFADVLRLAQASGFTPLFTRDLTDYLRLYRPSVLRLLKLVTRLPLPGRYWESHVGGTALQVCLRNGWVRYRFAAFRRLRA